MFHTVYMSKQTQYLDFETLEIADAEIGDMAVVRKSNGKYALAHYSHADFNDKPYWHIWNDEEYRTAFDVCVAFMYVTERRKGWWDFHAYVKFIEGTGKCKHML